MPFLQKSYSENTKVEKPVLVTVSYEGSEKEVEHESVPVINNNNNTVNIVPDSNSDDDIKNDTKNVFDKDINNEVEVTPQTTINAKLVHPMRI